MISKTMQSVLCDIIWMQCFTPFSHICINTNFTLLDSLSSTSITKIYTTSDMTVKCSSSSTGMDTTCHMTAKSSKTGDTASGK